MSGNPARISFVIPHKGREEMLRQTLQSIASQDYDLNAVEVFVATQNACLEADTLPDSALLKVNVLYRPENETISCLRNVGVKHSNGDFIAFLDADVDISSNWIKCMIEELAADPGRAMVSAVQRCDVDAPYIEKIRTVLSGAAHDAPVRFLPGANLFLRREVFTVAGGFPEHLATCEDYVFADRIHALGQLYLTSKSGFIHLGEDKSFRQMFKKEIWRGQSNLQSIRGRSVSLSELPSIAAPVWIAFFALGAISSLFVFELDGAMMLIALMLVPVFVYAERLRRVAKGTIPYFQLIKFYLIYFPARAIGLYNGLVRSLKH